VITPPVLAALLVVLLAAADEVVDDDELDELPHALNATIEASASAMVVYDLLRLLTTTSS
jgi:hypothetical protein